MTKKLTKAQIEANLKIKIPIWQKSPIKFVEDFWQLKPQPIKPEYEQALQILIQQNELKEIRGDRNVEMTFELIE